MQAILALMPNELDRSDAGAEGVIASWMVEFLDCERPESPSMTPRGLIVRLRRHGWHLVNLSGPRKA